MTIGYIDMIFTPRPLSLAQKIERVTQELRPCELLSLAEPSAPTDAITEVSHLTYGTIREPVLSHLAHNHLDLPATYPWNLVRNTVVFLGSIFQWPA